MARENGERRYGRVRLARFTREDHAYGASRLPKTTVLRSKLAPVVQRADTKLYPADKTQSNG